LQWYHLNHNCWHEASNDLMVLAQRHFLELFEERIPASGVAARSNFLPPRTTADDSYADVVGGTITHERRDATSKKKAQ
jgi:hypothetical protein